MKREAGLTLIELLIVVAFIALVAGLLVPGLTRKREAARRQRCSLNLRELAKGVLTYADFLGDNDWLHCPLGRCSMGSGAGTYNGAEWLASLYWDRCVADPDVFLCPSSCDSNGKGRDLGSHSVNDVPGGRFGSQTVSFAALWWKSMNTLTGGGISNVDPWGQPIACDDTQGGINHGTASSGGMNILYFNAHVEFRTSAELDITTRHGSVGKKPGLLWRLKN